ncbi:MAG: hypothetical protein SH859_03005 [Hyphomicrobium aestuarii]|nr:hypothetical protein [Hyphomicrobium aestuarii]
MNEIDDQERQDIMQRDVLLVATAACSLLNGQSFSPLLTMGAILLKPFVAGTLLASPIVFLYLTSLFVSIITLLLAGIPAALYERYKGNQNSTPMSLGIWFFATVFLTLPTFLNMGKPSI